MDGDFISLEKVYCILIKQNYSNRSCCRLLKSVCWSRMMRDQRMYFLQPCQCQSAVCVCKTGMCVWKA